MFGLDKVMQQIRSREERLATERRETPGDHKQSSGRKGNLLGADEFGEGQARGNTDWLGWCQWWNCNTTNAIGQLSLLLYIVYCKYCIF